MADLVTSPDPSFWAGRRVFLTGHTGFKGGWLTLWLQAMGAEVHGYALAPPTRPNLFAEAGVERALADHRLGDVGDPDALAAAMGEARPQVVIHMAAQPLVRRSYAQPVETFRTNVMGTVHVLEAARTLGCVEALVNVTTDKVYRNREWCWAYRENEALGGRDPYSGSKACAELATDAYRASFGDAGGPWIASARAGNVIGGGDWALDRIVPDALRALDAGAMLTVRSPDAIRPWQHVLEPLSGYLVLAEALTARGRAVAEPWNFGPGEDDARPVRWILERIRELRPELAWRVEGAGAHEARFLKVDSAKARAELGWAPRWDLRTAIARTVEWHDAWRAGEPMGDVCRRQIADYAGIAAHG